VTKIVVLVIALVGITIASIGLLPVFGSLYNQHLFPLGRLAKTIHEGDSFDAVRSKFIAYRDRHGEDRAIQFSEFESETDLLRTRAIPKSKGLHLYDESCFDDVQLTVLFDSDGRVSEKLLISD
jgi:hypothetical protein